MYLGFRKYLWTSLFSSLDVEGGLHTHESALLVGGRDGGKSVIAMFSSSRHKSLLRAGSTLCCRFCRVVEPQKNTNVGYKGVFGEGIVRPRMDFVPPSTWHMLYARSSFAFSSSSSNDPYRGDGRDASETKEKKKKTIRVVFVEKTGEEIAVDATVGESVMEAAHQNDVELEGTTCATKVLSDASRSLLLLSKRRRRLILIAHTCITHTPLFSSFLSRNDDNNTTRNAGACEGSLACSTCHVVVEDPEVFDKLPEACDDENDMLDLAFGLTETSRLGCQIIAKEDIDGIRVKIPAATRNFAVDGFVPKPH